MGGDSDSDIMLSGYRKPRFYNLLVNLLKEILGAVRYLYPFYGRDRILPGLWEYRLCL